MEFLILSILCSSSLFIFFKLFEKLNINTFQAIIINYFTAFSIGILSYQDRVIFSSIPNREWFLGAVILSFLFIAVFNLMAITSQKNGVSVASVAGKMSIIIPVIFGVYMYKEQLNSIKVIGIILALIAVYLTASKKEKNNQAGYLFPLLLFLGSGIIDTTIKYIQNTYVPISELPLFSAIIFLLAGCLGILLFLFNSSKPSIKSILSGIALGTVNYYSIIYLLKALDVKGMESSVVFTLNNVAIVACTTLLGLLFFSERLFLKNWIGIVIAIISILLISY